MFYIFNKDKQCISSCNAKPNVEDLATREEFVIEDSRHLNVSAIELHDNNTIFEKEIQQVEDISPSKEVKVDTKELLELVLLQQESILELQEKVGVADESK